MMWQRLTSVPYKVKVCKTPVIKVCSIEDALVHFEEKLAAHREFLRETDPPSA
jgi:hypothetical protein